LDVVVSDVYLGGKLMSDKITIKLTKSQAHTVIDALMDYIYDHPDSDIESEKVKSLVNAYTEILNQTVKGTK
jgi:hypothetical protein